MQDLRRIIWIASFPKSGNTWMRLLLANCFAPRAGFDINSVQSFSSSDVTQIYYDQVAGRPYQAASVEDWLQTRAKVLRTIVAARPGHHFVKTHSMLGQIGRWNLIAPEVTAGAIYLVRNPFDVLPSYARHLNKPLDQALDTMLDPDNFNYTPTRIAEMVGSWDLHVQTWTSLQGAAVHVIRYEDLLSDTLGQMQGLLATLQTPVEDSVLKNAITASSFKKLQKQERKKGFRERPKDMKQFFVSGQSGSWKKTLTPAQVARIRQHCLPMLTRFYPDLLDQTAEFANSAA